MLLHAIKLFSRSIFALGSFEKYLLTTRPRVAKVTHHSVRGEVACVLDDAPTCQRGITPQDFSQAQKVLKILYGMRIRKLCKYLSSVNCKARLQGLCKFVRISQPTPRHIHVISTSYARLSISKKRA